MRKSFTWFLSLMVLLTAFATHGYAQEEQETVELYAEEASYCYDEANDYTVTISVRDFIELSRFELNLEFNDAIFGFIGSSDTISSLEAGITVSESGGVVSIDWSGDATTIGDNVQTDVLELHFSVLGYPGNIAPSFESDMEWGTANFWYELPDESEDAVNTVIAGDGSLTVDVALSGITTDIAAEDCFGGDATVTVTAPDADMYLFNEDPDPDNWVWTSSASYQAAAGETVTIRVKDESGCISLKETVNIPETVDPVEFTVDTQDPACYGENGSVIINATGGTAPYEYYIADEDAESIEDAVIKNNFQFSQEPGTYWVAVQDANGCANLMDEEYWVEITIVDGNTELVAGATSEDVSCNGDTDGSIMASAAGGSGEGYMYSIDGTTWQDTVNFLNLAAGTYTVWVKDGNGCMDDTTGVIVDEPDPITFDMAIEDVTCGGDDDGQIIVTNIAGGTDPYTLEIEENGNPTSVALDPGETSHTFTGLKPTYYSLTITDAEGCVVEYVNPNNTKNVIAVQAPGEIEFEVETTDPLCADGPASVEIVDVTGGSGSYKYSFDGGSTWVDTMTVDNWVYPYATLNIAVTNAADSSCTVNYPTAITANDIDNPDELNAWIEEDFAPTCIDGTDGNVHLMIYGGTAPYYYSLNGGSWKMTEDNLTIIKVGVGTHEIMVKDANDCAYEGEGDLEVTISLDPNVIWAESDGNIDCFGEKSGTISLYFDSWADGLTGGTPDQPNRGHQYYVENEAGQISSFMPSNQGGTATTFNAGTYIVWVVDQYTCESNTDTVEITENPELMITEVIANGASCFGTSEGSITVHATGGNVDGLLEYAIVNNQGALENIGEDKWLDFETYDPETTLSTVSFNVDGGTYWIAVRDACDEMDTWGPEEVAGYDELLVDEDDITYSDPLCNEEDNGTITVPMEAVSGGAGAYLFTLLDGDGDPIEDYVDQATGAFTGLPAGTYAVLVEDAEDCPSYTTEDIVLMDPPALDFATTIKHFSCEDTNDGRITVTIDGTDTGTPDYWYAINNQNTWLPFGEDVVTKTYIATEPGTFRVWVKDANGCIAGPDTVVIEEPVALTAEVEVTTEISCYGEEDAVITVEGFGGWEGMTTYQFSVDDGDTWTSAYSAGMTATIGGLGAGDHILLVKDGSSYSDPYQQLDCEYGVPFTIDDKDPITYDVAIEDVKCKGGSDGTFTVEILHGGTPIVDTEGDDDGFLVRLTGTGYDSGWEYTGEDNIYTFEGLAHSHYTVYIMDDNGCELPEPIGDDEGPYTTEESWEVNEPDTELTLEAEFVQDATCYGEEDGLFMVYAEGGSPDYKYYAGLSIEPSGHILVPEHPAEDSDEWQESNEFNVGAGTWVVWVMDSNGCIVGGETDEFDSPVNEWRVKIEQPDSIEWAFHTVYDEELEEDVVHYVQPSCYGEWDGQIHIWNNSESIIGGAGVYHAHVWGTTASGEVFDSTYVEIDPDGSLYKLGGVPASDDDGFEVTVMDTMGCTSAVDTIYIDQPEEIVVDLVKAEGSFTCAGAVEGFIETMVSGGEAPYEYQLLKNGVIHTPWQSDGSAYLVEVGNTFTVQVRDANDCEAEASIDIDPVQEVLIASVDDRSCFGDDAPTAVVTATAEEGRMLYVRHRKVEGASTLGPWSDWVAFNEEHGVGTHVYNDVLTYGDDNESDGHYRFQVKDEMDCISDSVFKTFVPVQNELMMTTEVEGDMITVTATGGAVDSEQNHHYQYALGTVEGGEELVWQDENMLMLDSANTYVVFVRDYHWCWKTDTVDAGYATMMIADIQGGADMSPVVDEVVGVTGTVTGVADGEGFFMQDGNGAWNGIWVADADAAWAVGDGVFVVGTVAEVDDVTSILADEVTAATPVEVAADTLASPSAAQNEMYESVLVVAKGVRAAEADENGQWEVYYETTDSVVVNDWLHAYAPVAGNFYHVTGVVNGKLNAFTMEPRMDEDIVDLTTTGVGPAPTVEFKVYPNPFNSYITIDNNDKLTRVVVNNIAGQRVMDVKYPSREIRTANLVSGVYVVSLFTEDGLAKTERIVKR